MSVILSALVELSANVDPSAVAQAGPAPMIANPFPGVPDFTSLGGKFTEWWQRLFAVGWGIGLIVAGAYLIVGLVAMAKADSNNPHAHAEGKKKAMGAGIGLSCLAGFAVIVGAILAVAG
jgi:hypothetical protein